MVRKTGRPSAAELIDELIDELIAAGRQAIEQPNADKERSVRPP
jgi:hypothetical protein